MRIHIEGRHTKLEPHLVGRIAEQLDDLNTPDEDIFEVHVTIIQQKRWETARMQVLLAGTTLRVTQRGPTSEAAVDAAMRKVREALQDFRAARSRTRGSGCAGQRGVHPSLPCAAGEDQLLPAGTLQRAAG